MTFLEPETEYRNFLRNNLTDYNSSGRSSKQWVFDDEPRDDLVPASYPRISIKKITGSQKLIGIADNDMRGTISLQVDVRVHRMVGVISVTETDEAVGTTPTNSPRFNLNYLPDSVTNIKHNSSSYTLVSVVNESSFTAPGSLATGTVEWCKSTGRMNFSTADISSHAGQSITSTYVRTLEGEKMAMRIARDVVKVTKAYWRTDDLIGGLRIPVLLNDPQLLPFDDKLGTHHAIVEFQFTRYNIGEEVT